MDEGCRPLLLLPEREACRRWGELMWTTRPASTQSVALLTRRNMTRLSSGGMGSNSVSTRPRPS